MLHHKIMPKNLINILLIPLSLRLIFMQYIYKYKLIHKS